MILQAKDSILEYVKLTYSEINELNRDKTIFLMSVSPIEVHGYHLPLGTDVFISEGLLKLYASSIIKKYPDYKIVKLPPLYLGADALPLPGSLSIHAKRLEGILFDFGEGLAKQGFKYLFLADNHGGPRHQMAIEMSARRLWKRYRFYLLDPFNSDFRKMVQIDQDFLKGTGLNRGSCGDDSDSHAGTNETSLMLQVLKSDGIEPDLYVKPHYKELDTSLPVDHKGLTKFISSVGKILQKLGGKELARDLEHLANTLAWVSYKNMLPYMGDPKLASSEAGEAMLKTRVENAMELFDRAINGEAIHLRPLLWKLRILRYF